MKMVIDSNIALGRRAIDELLARYIAWREECHTVQLAYQQCAGDDRSERERAYAGYLAALDREERAACAYADHVDRVRRLYT
jgi:hypothetical protein